MAPSELVGSGQTAEILAIDADRVMKLFKPGTSPQFARREADNTQIAYEVGLPVPTVHEVTSVDDRPAIIYERITGPTMGSQLTSQPWTILRNARRLAILQMSIHGVHSDEVRPLSQKLRHDIQNAPGISTTVRKRVLSKLDTLPEGSTLCHYDFHPENILISNDGPVVIDWLDAGRGHPAADVARTNLLLRYTNQKKSWISLAFRRALRWWYLYKYCDETAVTWDQIRDWELPIAVARLTEGVPEEPWLRSFIRSRLTKA